MRSSFISHIVALLTLISIASSCNNPDEKDTIKTGFVSTSELFQEFEMTKEYQKEMQITIEKRQEILDSLKLRIEATSRYLNTSPEVSQEDIMGLNNLQSQYIKKKEEFDALNVTLSSQYDQSIWKRLNELVQEFAKENAYTYIYGATGSGNLMYADESVDLTDDLILYCNKKYQGR